VTHALPSKITVSEAAMRRGEHGIARLLSWRSANWKQLTAILRTIFSTR
jgi:hypothetical protein